MVPRTKEQFEEIREEKKGLIMETGLELFATDGYHNVSVKDIAKSANISKGLMYNYFSSKEALLLAIAQKGFKEITKAFDLDNDGILTENELTHFIRHSFRSLNNNKSFWRLYFMLLLQCDVAEIIQKEYQPLQDRLRDIALGFFEKRGYPDPKTEMMMLDVLLDGIAMHYLFSDDTKVFPIDKMEEYVISKYNLPHEK